MEPNDDQTEASLSTNAPAPSEQEAPQVAAPHVIEQDDSIDTPSNDRGRQLGKMAREWVLVIVGAVVLAMVVRSYVLQTFYIPSASMETTLMTGDRILVNKLAYHFHPIHRGDIVVFARPPAENCAGPVVPDLVKRVIGLPGDRLTSRGDTIYINGSALKEPWLPANGKMIGTAIPPITVQPGQYFVMGDNRSNSCDSRMWGTVSRNLIVGEVQLILWPFSQFGFPD